MKIKNKIADDTNIVRTFFKLRCEQLAGIDADVLFYLNKELNTKYQHSRVSQWIKGQYQPSGKVVAYMTNYILEHELQKLKASKKKIKKILNLITLPSSDKKELT